MSGYCFTDLPGAYVRVAIEAVAGRWLAEQTERWAERYVKSTFERCDLVRAPPPRQAERLTHIGVDDIHVVVLGVDLDTFHPARANPALPSELGLPGRVIVVVYVDRPDSEKRTTTMVEAVRLANDRSPVTS